MSLHPCDSIMTVYSIIQECWGVTLHTSKNTYPFILALPISSLILVYKNYFYFSFARSDRECPGSADGGVGTPGTWVTDRQGSSWGCWEVNPGPVQEQPVLLMAGLSLQPQSTEINNYPQTACWAQKWSSRRLFSEKKADQPSKNCSNSII